MCPPRTISLSSIPQKPGVYLFRDASGSLMYIGKAKRLKNRVSSYFHKSSALAPDKQTMLGRIAKVEFIQTRTETEALLLESNLIKKNQPPYNINLKDDKSFTYIKITTSEEYPRVFTVRNVMKDGARYFGPYTAARPVKDTLKTLHTLFPHRNFSSKLTQKQADYYTRRYPELIGPADPGEYKKNIEHIIRFLKGDYAFIQSELTKAMRRLAEKKQFERAAHYRDVLRSIDRLTEQQIVISPRKENQDILGLAREASRTAVTIFMVRQGKLLGSQNFLLTNTQSPEDREVLQTFAERYYAQHTDPPRHILVPFDLPDSALLEKSFGLKVIIPRRGVKRKYIELGHENAKNYLVLQKASWERSQQNSQEALEELKKKLRLKHIPHRIETYDISNIQGSHAVGSMIVFRDGQPDRSAYRKFKIKSVSGSNDPAMMAEIISRRLKHLPSATKNKPWPEPDLILLDGGKGQLGVIQKILPPSIPVAALAKKQELLFVPGQKKPITFSRPSQVLFLIQRMRDEAHRFAIAFYRNKHRVSARHSKLDDVPGIGPQTKKKLLRHFGSVRRIQNASLDELKKVVTDAQAESINQFL